MGKIKVDGGDHLEKADSNPAGRIGFPLQS
jgi:hypothetical protein